LPGHKASGTNTNNGKINVVGDCRATKPAARTPTTAKNSHSPPLLRVCADGRQGGNTNNQQGG